MKKLLLTVALISPMAQAELVTFYFKGEVKALSETHPDLTIAIGDSVDGFGTYDINTAASDFYQGQNSCSANYMGSIKDFYIKFERLNKTFYKNIGNMLLTSFQGHATISDYDRVTFHTSGSISSSEYEIGESYVTFKYGNGGNYCSLSPLNNFQNSYFDNMTYNQVEIKKTIDGIIFKSFIDLDMEIVSLQPICSDCLPCEAP